MSFNTWPTNSTVHQYRRVFSTKDGQQVLQHILFELGVFQESIEESDVVLRNYGTRLLKILSGDDLHGPDGHAIMVFLQQAMKQQLKKETPDE